MLPSKSFIHPAKRQRSSDLKVDACRIVCKRLIAFTLIELLVVVAIIAILAVIGVANFSHAQERALRAADASNLHTVATALQTYLVDFNTLPPADRVAGPFPSHTLKQPGNGPAAGGSWDGLPWLLVDLKYIGDWETLFCPKYLKLYRGGQTHRGDHPRFHNFRYAYNSSALSSGGHTGGAGNIMSGEVWLVRDLWWPAKQGWWAEDFPQFPADYRYPWGPEEDLEHAMYSDMAVRLVVGGTDRPPTDYPTP